MSYEPAESLVKYPVNKGIDTSRLEFKGYGPNRPIDKRDTEKGRANNRRVEFINL